MTIKLVIIGASRALQEIAGLVAAINGAETGSARYHIVGALDDNEELHGKRIDGIPVLGPLATARAMPDMSFVYAISSYANRLKRIEFLAGLELSHERFVTLIHPGAEVYSSAVIGRGAAIYKNVIVFPNCRIGDFVVIYGNTTLNPGCVICDYALIAGQVFVGAGARIGPAAFLAGASSVKEGVKIGPGAIVGMATPALHDVPAGTTVVGNPARAIGKIEVPLDLLQSGEEAIRD